MGEGRGRLISATDRKILISLIEEAFVNGARLSLACREVDISKRTYKRWKKHGLEDKRKTCKRPTPKNKLTPKEREQILSITNSKEYSSSSASQIVPSLADKGVYIASESTFYRIQREDKQLQHRGKNKLAIKKELESHKATGPNQVWVWDITYLPGAIKGLHYYLYMISDIYSRKIVGWEVWEEENAIHASELIQKAYLREGLMLTNRPLVLHSDNGSPMKAATMLEMLYTLGITPSRSRPRVSNDNAYAESLFKTLKYRPSYMAKGFVDIVSARNWVIFFVNWYNKEHKHSGIKYLSPLDRHNGDEDKIIAKRKRVYELAKKKHPERWSRGIRNWSLEKFVWLNPSKDLSKEEKTS